MLYVTQSLMLLHAMHTTQIHFGSSGMTHWKIRSVICEVECASLCNNSLPDDYCCLKFCLDDAKVHQIILQRSKICMLNGKRVLNMPKFKQKPSSFRWLQLHNLVYIVPVTMMI